MPTTPTSAPPAAAASPQAAASRLQRAWQTRGPLAWALWPLSQLYGALVGLRRGLYRSSLLRAEHPGRPVIVVGNVIAGGAGKTPVVIALVRHLQSQGLKAGVISRGYGRSDPAHCLEATPQSPASAVGDEPALIARSCPGTPVWVAPQRITAARALLAAHPEVDVIVCDDGLQHLALQRDIEICIFNDQGVGNGFLLPAGPLREPWPRAVDLVLYAGSPPPRLAAPVTTPSFALQRGLAPHALRADGSRVALSTLRGQPLHALAAVARPADFFAMLRAQGLTLAQTEALPDHYNFDSYKALNYLDLQLICTEKDAVKLWQHAPQALAVPLQLTLDPAFFATLDARLAPLLAARR